MLHMSEKYWKNNKSRRSRITKWKIATIETKNYIEIILWISIHKYSQISDHWNNDISYMSNFHKFMSL